MRENNSQWINLAARLIRVVLARKDIGYAELAKRLQVFDSSEDEKALARRVSLGQVKLTLFLQVLTAAGAAIPALWRDVIKDGDGWEARAAAILAVELGQCPAIGKSELVKKMLALGIALPEVKLVGQLESGTFSVPVFLRALVVLRSPSLEMYLDYSDLLAAAQGELGNQFPGADMRA